MSQDVSFSAKDYGNIIKWFELAFAKKNTQTLGDRNTFTKLSAMAMSYTEEEKEEKEDLEGDE